MYIYRNPNPCKSLVGDCVVRAISLAEKKNWDIVFWDLCDKAFNMCDMPSSNEVWSAYLLEHGYKCYMLPQNCYKCYTIKDFCNDYNKGIYILGTGTHAVVVIDGNIYDTWDSKDETPIYYWTKEN